jgi:hypothetical protein
MAMCPIDFQAALMLLLLAGVQAAHNEAGVQIWQCTPLTFKMRPCCCCLQEFKLLIMRQVFRYGNVPQWRSIIRSMTSHEVPGLQMTRVPPSTFKVGPCLFSRIPEFRSSAWHALLFAQRGCAVLTIQSAAQDVMLCCGTCGSSRHTFCLPPRWQRCAGPVDTQIDRLPEGHATTADTAAAQPTQPVPAAYVQGAGWRDSWWVELPHEQQPERPNGSLVLMYLHGKDFFLRCFGVSKAAAAAAAAAAPVRKV